ncbi:MAG: TonB-dependent receptor domain-containing protein [Terriglobia bacterium]
MRRDDSELRLSNIIILLLACALAVPLLGVRSALGQTTFGSIIGTVTDPSGAAVPGVSITLTNLSTSVTEVTTSNTAGIYEFVNVPPGNYKIDATKAGFKHFTRSPIVVEVAGDYRVNAAMQLGAVTQTVQVRAATPLLQSQTSSLGQVIAGRSVTEMPLNGRNVFNLMDLVTSVVPGGESQGTPVLTNPGGWFNYQINGALGGESAIYLDGEPLSGSLYHTIVATLIPSQDSIQEFKVQTNNLGPEWGRFAGGVMNLVTKSGTNQIHGEAYEYLRNKALNSNTFFGNKARISTPPFTQNQFGADAGGPIVIPGIYNGKDKSFWFLSWEGFRLRQGLTFTDTMPTAAELTGDFSNLRDSSENLVPIYNPLTVCGEFGNPACSVGAKGQPIYTRAVLAGNVIPTSMLNPTALKLESLWAKANEPGQAFTNVNNFTTNVPTGGNENSAVTRIDHTISDKQHIFGRYTYWNNLTLPAEPLGSGICINQECEEIYHTNDVVLDDTYTFTPTLIADVHLGFDRLNYAEPPGGPTGVDLTSIGWPASYNTEMPPSYRFLPTPCVTGMALDLFCTTSGASTSLGTFTGSTDNNWILSGDITKISGKHTVKAGGQFLVLQDNHLTTGDPSGLFGFTGAWTASSPFSGSGGFGFADYLLGYFSNGSGSFEEQPAGQQKYWAVYVGDTWQASKKLTLNLGVRYEQDRPMTERFNRLSLINLNAPNPLTTGTTLPAQAEVCLVATPCNPSRSDINADDTQFSPRLGFAYQLTHNTVVRGGYGWFWIPESVNWVVPERDPVNSVDTTAVGSLNDGITPYANFSNPFPTGILHPPARSPNYQSTFLGQNVAMMVPNIPYPLMQQWNFDVQRELPKGFFLDLAYAGSRGEHLSSTNNNFQALDQLSDSDLSLGTALTQQVLNPYFGLVTSGPLSAPTVSRGQLLRRYPEYDGLSELASGYASSFYNSFQLKLQKQFKGGGDLLVSYTNEKLITNTEGVMRWLEGGTGGLGLVQDWNCTRCAYSLDTLDVPQRLVISYVTNLPIGEGQRFLSGTHGLAGKLISGWEVDGITTFERGFPLIFGTAKNLTNSYGGGSLPNVTPGCVSARSGNVESRLNDWFNAACFTQPPAFTFGDEARVDPVLRQQGINDFDFALVKNTRFGPRESLGLEFRAEFFNLFNTPQFGPPDTTVGTPQFGIVSGQVNNPRLIQFALKFLF